MAKRLLIVWLFVGLCAGAATAQTADDPNADQPSTGSDQSGTAESNPVPASDPDAADTGESQPAAVAVSAENQAASDKQRIAGDEFVKSGKYPAAISAYESAIKLDPNNLLARMNCGSIRLLNNDAEGAINDLTIVIDRRPSLWKPLAIRGRAYLKKGDAANAILDLNKSLAIKSDNKDAFIDRGEAKLSIEDFTGALDDFRSVLKLDANNWRAWSGVAIASRCLDDQPGYAHAVNRLRVSSSDPATALRIVDERAAQFEMIRKGRQLDAGVLTNGEDYLARARYRFTNYEYELAIEDARKAAELSRRTCAQESHVIMAASYHKLGNLFEAVRLQKMAVSEIKKTDSEERKTQLKETLEIYENELKSARKK